MIDVLAVNVSTPRVLAERDGVRIYSSIAKVSVPNKKECTAWRSTSSL